MPKYQILKYFEYYFKVFVFEILPISGRYDCISDMTLTTKYQDRLMDVSWRHFIRKAFPKRGTESNF